MTTSASGTTIWAIKEFEGTEFTQIGCVIDYQEGDEFREPNETEKLETKNAKGSRPGTQLGLDPDVFTVERDPCSDQDKCLVGLHRNGLEGAPPEASVDDRYCIVFGIAFCTDPVCWLEFIGWIERRSFNQQVNDADLTTTLTVQRKSCTDCTNDPALIPPEVQAYYDELETEGLQQFTAQQLKAATEVADKLLKTSLKGKTNGQEATGGVATK